MYEIESRMERASKSRQQMIMNRTFATESKIDILLAKKEERDMQLKLETMEKVIVKFANKESKLKKKQKEQKE